MPWFPDRENILRIVEAGSHVISDGVRRNLTLPERLTMGVQWAAMIGDLQVLEDLLGRGAKIGPLALIAAARWSRVDSIRLLLTNGADVNGAFDSGYTPLMAAVLASMPEAARLLLAAGADPKAVDASGKTALDLARDALAQSDNKFPHEFETIRVLEEAQGAGQLPARDRSQGARYERASGCARRSGVPAFVRPGSAASTFFGSRYSALRRCQPCVLAGA